MSLVRRHLSPRGRRLSRYVAALAAMAAVLMAGCTQMSILAWNQVPMTEFRVDGTRLYMQGAINSQTLKQFEDVYAKHPDIKTLVELDVPGSLDDDTMIALAYRVRELGLNTHLEASSLIQSGGGDLFLAGVRRTMEPGAKIGVHSWSDGARDAKDYPRDAPEHEQNRLYIEHVLGDESFYWFTIYAASADGMHFMTSSEIKKYGLLTN